jgi:hypothetical protein
MSLPLSRPWPKAWLSMGKEFVKNVKPSKSVCYGDFVGVTLAS